MKILIPTGKQKEEKCPNTFPQVKGQTNVLIFTFYSLIINP